VSGLEELAGEEAGLTADLEELAERDLLAEGSG